MIDDASLAAVQRSLNEHREAKRKIKIRLAEIEAEAEMLRAQLSMHDAIIQQSELMMRRVLFPTDEASNLPSNSSVPAYHPPADVEIEAEVAKIRQHEKKSNVRFNDFRIPQAATIVLREANGPLHVSEIYRQMAEGGFEFRGQHQLITLAVSLSRSKRFRKVAPGTFALAPDEDMHDSEEADHFPHSNVSNSSS